MSTPEQNRQVALHSLEYIEPVKRRLILRYIEQLEAENKQLKASLDVANKKHEARIADLERRADILLGRY